MAKQSNPFKTNDIISLQNVDSEDFEFEYNRSESNSPYLIPAGEVRRFPGWLASHALKHLLDKILTKAEEKTNNVVKRRELAEKIVVSVESLQQKREPSEAELLREKIKKMNEPSDLELLLSRREQENKKKLKEDKKEVAREEEKKKELKRITERKPTKKELMNYASDKLKMTMNKKTRRKLLRMTVDELIKELDHPWQA